MTRPARVIVNVAAIQANFDFVRRTAPDSKVMAIVKADGYGHGVARVAKALQGRAHAYGVASLEEAEKLREAGVETPVVLLEGPFDRDDVARMHELNLESVVHNEIQAKQIAEYPSHVAVWIKIDTGMHRLGFNPDAVAEALDVLRVGGREIRFMTHLASAHQRDDSSVDEQLALFGACVGNRPGEQSVANSGGVIGWPATHLDWVRPGIMLYGVSPYAGEVGADIGLTPAMTVESKLISIRDVEAGGSVGYGKAYICPEKMRVGVVAFGYGDGYPRHAGSGTPIEVAGIRTQVIGEASMDMMTVDLRAVPGAKIGDRVVLWGPELPVETVAASAATIPYELLCQVRVRAHYSETS